MKMINCIFWLPAGCISISYVVYTTVCQSVSIVFVSTALMSTLLVLVVVVLETKDVKGRY